MINFADKVKDFQALTAQEAQERIDSGDKFVLFLGRSTCMYCCRFVPKLAKVAAEKAIPVAFINSSDREDASAIEELRSRYQIPTVPGLLVAQDDQVKVVCDSSLSEEAIADFIG